MCHCLLNHAPADAYAAHQAPVTMDFAVLLAGHVAQVHVRYQRRQTRKENTLGRHYTPNCALPLAQVSDPVTSPPPKIASSGS